MSAVLSAEYGIGVRDGKFCAHLCVDTLLDDSTGTLSAAEGCPAALLAPTDRDRTWSLGPSARDKVQVRGAAAAVLGWLVGRSDKDAVEALAADGTPTAVPAPPRWL